MQPTKPEIIIESVNQTAWQEFKATRWGIPVLAVSILLALAILILSRGGAFELILYGFAGAWAFVADRFVRKARGKMISQFAVANGYQYSPIGDIQPRNGSVFDHNGHSEKIEDMVEGVLGGHSFRFFRFRYTTGHGKESMDHDQSIMVLEFSGNLPHIVVDSKHKESLSFPFKTKQLVELEGDFRKYFRLYIPKEYEIEALSLLTPDVMAQLIDKSSNFDVEFIGHRIYIYDNGLIATRKELIDLYELATTLVKELDRQLKNFKTQVIHPTMQPVLKKRWGNFLVMGLDRKQSVVIAVVLILLAVMIVCGLILAGL